MPYTRRRQGSQYGGGKYHYIKRFHASLLFDHKYKAPSSAEDVGKIITYLQEAIDVLKTESASITNKMHPLFDLARFIENIVYKHIKDDLFQVEFDIHLPDEGKLNMGLSSDDIDAIQFNIGDALLNPFRIKPKPVHTTAIEENDAEDNNEDEEEVVAHGGAGGGGGGGIEDKIRAVVFSFYEAKQYKSEIYTLTFSFDGVRFSTNFIINAASITNGCIDLVGYYDKKLYFSAIRANNPERSCFHPSLQKTNLPDGVTQTDILQVISTKLKFILLYPMKHTSLMNAARIINPKTGEAYTTLFSAWRILRDERTIYEKYGYTSDVYDTYREASRNIKWGEIKNYIINIDTGYTIEQLWNDSYPEKAINDDMTIKDVMRIVSYDELERSVFDGKLVQKRSGAIYTMKADIVGFICAFITQENPKSLILPTDLVVKKSNDVWKTWDSRCIFLSFEPTKPAGGRRKPRKTRRRK
jgi:hypothetical protein